MRPGPAAEVDHLPDRRDLGDQLVVDRARPRGQPARNTDSGAPGQAATTSDCHMCSARNGVTGAITLIACTSPVHSVRSAAVSLFQNRRRDRLMYQFDRSSR